jgi:hypothetical protein
VENRLRHSGAADFHSSALRIGRLRRRGDKYARPETFIVTPHGISTLIITPTATNASDKALEYRSFR